MPNGGNSYEYSCPFSPTILEPTVGLGKFHITPFIDATAEVGKTYDYWVEWVRSDGEERFGPVRAQLYYYTWLPSVSK